MDDGAEVDRDLVELAEAAVIVPVLPDGSVGLIRNERFAVGEVLFELPAGKLDGEEPAESAAARELTEETGYVAGRMERLGGFYTSPGAITEYIHAFLATELEEGTQRLEASERITREPVRPERLAEMIRTGEVHDAKTIAAWSLWQFGGGAA